MGTAAVPQVLEPWDRSPDVHHLRDHVIVPIVKLDPRNVTKLPAVNGRRSEYRDALLPAFFLRVSPSGARIFGVAYNTPAGQRRRYTIGNAARTSLADARDVARRVLADVIKGQDPQQQKVAERRKRRAGVLTFTDLARRFMRENEGRLADTTRYNWTNIIDSEIARGSLGAMRPDEITRQTCVSSYAAWRRTGRIGPTGRSKLSGACSPGRSRRTWSPQLRASASASRRRSGRVSACCRQTRSAPSGPRSSLRA